MVLRPASLLISRGVTADGPLVAIASLPSLEVMKFDLVPNASAVTPISANTARQSAMRASGDLTIISSVFFRFGSGLIETPVRIRGGCSLPPAAVSSLRFFSGVNHQQSRSYRVARINFQLAECDGKLRAASGRNLT